MVLGGASHDRFNDLLVLQDSGDIIAVGSANVFFASIYGHGDALIVRLRGSEVVWARVWGGPSTDARAEAFNSVVIYISLTQVPKPISPAPTPHTG